MRLDSVDHASPYRALQAFEALTGSRPFEGEASAMLRAKINSDPPPPSARTDVWIPPHLETVVMRCLARDPSERYADAGELVHALIGCPMRGVSVEQEIGTWDDVTVVDGRSILFGPPALAALLDP